VVRVVAAPQLVRAEALKAANGFGGGVSGGAGRQQQVQSRPGIWSGDARTDEAGRGVDRPD
jgi:hypothetical protein